MTTSSDSSIISIAEEISEKSASNIDYEPSLIESEVTQSLNQSKSCPHFNKLPIEDDLITTNELDNYGSPLYDAIQPHHIRILDLHVDPKLKPDHLLNQTNENIYSLQKMNVIDPNVDLKRRHSIMQFLIAGSRQQPTNHNDDVILLSTGQVSFDLSSEKSNGNSSCEMAQKDSEYINYEAGGGGEAFINQLDFQINLKNERSHFILSEILMQSIQKLISEHQLLRNKRTREQRPTFSLSAQNKQYSVDSDTNSTSTTTPQSTFSSRADKLAASMIDDITALSSQIGATELWMRKCLPNNLLEGREDIWGPLSMRPSMLDTSLNVENCDISSPLTTSTNNQMESEQLIKAAMGNNYTSVYIPVGGQPMLTPDLCLPSYVAAQSPPPRKRNELLKYQHNSCPGCHGPLPPESSVAAKRLRVCRYYGMIFCSTCHCNTLMLIPARILNQWDFSMLPVSKPARDLLSFIHTIPLFSPIKHFSTRVRENMRSLASVTRLRIQASHLLTFVSTCRQGAGLMKLVSKLPTHWLSCKSTFGSTDELNLSNSLKNNNSNNDSDKSPILSSQKQLYSVSDMRLLDNGEMERLLKSFVSGSIEHVTMCPLCQARGFICELCSTSTNSAKTVNSNRDIPETQIDILFPFEIDRVIQCGICRACVHRSCLQEFIMYTKSSVDVDANKMDFEDYSPTWCMRCRRQREREAREHIDLADISFIE